MCRREVAMGVPDVFIKSSAWIQHLHITGQIPLTICLGELIERLVRNLRHVEFMISNSQNVIVQLLEDRIGELPVHASWEIRTSVRQSCSVVEIASIDQQKVDIKRMSLLLHVFAKADKIAPIGPIVLFLQIVSAWSIAGFARLALR